MIGTNWCQDAGIYEFDLLGDKVKARYSFIYKFEDGEWKVSLTYEQSRTSFQSMSLVLTPPTLRLPTTTPA